MGFGFASTANSIARIAARRATSGRWTSVTAEAMHVHLRLNGEGCLLTAVSSAAAFVAERAGLESAAQADLVAAVDEACRDTFPILSEADPVLSIDLENFADRVEVVLEHHGPPRPAAGLESFIQGGQGLAGGASGLSLLSRVDRVQYSAQSGASRTTLTKYLRPLVSEMQ
jgi:anti-sigma regulatory factor (Ser/Thr protein kinase)